MDHTCYFLSSWRCRHLRRAREFLDNKRKEAPACMVLDVRLPGLSGLDLQRELSDRDIRFPIIFMTGHADIPMTVQA